MKITYILENNRVTTWKDYAKTFLIGEKKARQMLKLDMIERNKRPIMVSHFESNYGVYPKGFSPVLIPVEIGTRRPILAESGKLR